MRLIGFDPGSSSPSAAVYQTVGTRGGNIIAVFDVPMFGLETKRRIDVLALVDLIQNYGVTSACIELVNAMPSIPDPKTGERRGMGATSAFKFGVAFGDLRTTVRLCGFEPRFVVPRVWKKFYSLPGGDKEASRQLALDLFPNIAEFLQRKMDEGRAEACLIARWGAHAAAGDDEIPE